MRRARTLFVVAVFLGLLPTLRAQTMSPADVAADRLFNRVMSPYCPGRVLATCPSGAAETLRQEVRRDLAGGKSAEEIEAGLYRRFGNSIRAMPQTRGIGLLAWVLPAAVFALSWAWLVAWLRRPKRSNEETAETGNIGTSSELLDRLDEELADLD